MTVEEPRAEKPVKDRVGLSLTLEEIKMLRAMIPVYSGDRGEQSQTAGRVIRGAYALLVENGRIRDNQIHPDEFRPYADMLRGK